VSGAAARPEIRPSHGYASAADTQARHRLIDPLTEREGEAERILTDEVVRPALAAPPGLGKLAAVCEAFFSYVERRVFPGGCFFAATALEMGARPGPVKERVAAIQSDFTALLRTFAATAIEQHELPAHEDPDGLAFELHAILLGGDTKFILHDDPAVMNLARRVVHQRLGLDHHGAAGES